jgi:pseudoazurin
MIPKNKRVTAGSQIMHICLILFTIITFQLISGVILADTIQIEFTENDSYSVEVARINAGDTIEWLPKNEGHNVEFLAGPEMALLSRKSKIDEVYSVVFKVPGVYLYQCTPHGNMGMLGLIIVSNDFHNVEKVKKIQLSTVARSVLARLIGIARSG